MSAGAWQRAVVVATAAFSLLAAAPVAAQDVDPARLNRNYNDHLAFVASFMLPGLARRCDAVTPGYVARTAPLFLDWMAANQDRIERGRLLTQSELPVGQSLSEYRSALVANRLGRFDASDAESRRATCEGVAAVIGGRQMPGSWP